MGSKSPSQGSEEEEKTPEKKDIKEGGTAKEEVNETYCSGENEDPVE